MISQLRVIAITVWFLHQFFPDSKKVFFGTCDILINIETAFIVVNMTPIPLERSVFCRY